MAKVLQKPDDNFISQIINQSARFGRIHNLNPSLNGEGIALRVSFLIRCEPVGMYPRSSTNPHISLAFFHC